MDKLKNWISNSERSRFIYFCIVGAALLYCAYMVVSTAGDKANVVPLYIFAGVFALVGVVLVVFGLVVIVLKKYKA